MTNAGDSLHQNQVSPRPVSVDGATDWIARWQKVARRIRVPLGFVTAALYLFELWRRAPQSAAVAWSLALVQCFPMMKCLA